MRLFLNEFPDNKDREVIFTDKYFYLNVTGDLYVDDMAVFWEWEDYTGWINTDVPKGIYRVSLEGVHLLKGEETVYCYDLIFEKTNQLGIRDVEPRSDSRIY